MPPTDGGGMEIFMKKVVFFGTGGLAQFLVRYVKKDVTIVAYIDSYEIGGKINGVPILPVSALAKMDYDYVVIAFSNIERGKRILVEQGVATEKIIGYHYNGVYNYDNNPYQLKCDNFLQELLSTDKIEDLFELPEKKYYLCSMNIPEEREIIEHDFVREQTLALLAREIRRKNVSGNVAELGVYKGDFSKKINRLFPDRILYLFDTFEGFSNDDVRNDSSLNWGAKLEHFKDTSVDKVLERMPYKEKCVVKKGYFPDTFDLEEEFSFVSIDVDLYDPIRAGMEIFYPRLSTGGYIMIHDYNNLLYSGSREAVQEYCDKNNISIIPIPDMAGSVVVTK